jgi:hypothetical protein
VRPPDDWRRYVAPAAFLLAVTIAVVLVRAGLQHGGSTGGTRTSTARSQGSPASAGTSTVAGKRYWRVRAGDTFAVISAKTGVPVATIERLNPNVTSTSLFIGERIRYR